MNWASSVTRRRAAAWESRSWPRRARASDEDLDVLAELPAVPEGVVELGESLLNA